MQTAKFIISGAAGAGKSQMIRTVSEIDMVATVRQAIGGARLLRSETTAVLDYGRLTVADDLQLQLFAMPGLMRFDLLWEIIAEGRLGLIVLVDATRPDTFREAGRIVAFFQGLRRMPYLLAATKQDLHGAWSIGALRQALRLAPDEVLLPCVATDRDSVRHVLLDLLYTVMTQAD